MIKGIEHLAIVSNDTSKIKDWYIDMFDVKVVYDNGKGTYFVAFEDGNMIEFITTENAFVENETKTPGIRHIALSVGDGEFDIMVDNLKKANVEVVTEVVLAPNGIKTFFFRDVDRNILHLIYRPNPLV